ncbi:uncharacterized protein BDZ99DRAFT_220780 [Mytilinidion resinicola]|uniref:Uncharacterized protein n=1 Tax=Mytilinidion resinicola TaxID=574789 RepID=A0A6A6Y0B0_9PEZI|nr:uncharacterized protein BDZ99DRAFT_220780 [Mytilinidion resinicola]KAF2801444.1 hypothetical protein BDZ99DRAFT_220780 [Mytilinidion resinicola]
MPAFCPNPLCAISLAVFLRPHTSSLNPRSAPKPRNQAIIWRAQGHSRKDKSRNQDPLSHLSARRPAYHPPQVKRSAFNKRPRPSPPKSKSVTKAARCLSLCLRLSTKVALPYRPSSIHRLHRLIRFWERPAKSPRRLASLFSHSSERHTPLLRPIIMLISCSLPVPSSPSSGRLADSFQPNVSRNPPRHQASPPPTQINGIPRDCTRTTSAGMGGSSVRRRLAEQRQERQIAGCRFQNCDH